MPCPAIFFDRDGVLVEDRGVLTSVAALRVLPGVPAALTRLKAAGFRLIVISNQSVVARGLLTEQQLDAIHDKMRRLLEAAGAPPLDAVYACPHHPNADVPAYRQECQCRKPRPGMLFRAAAEHDLDLSASFMLGDRPTDITAGARAGCRTVLVLSSETSAPSIVTVDPLDESLRPDFTCPDLPAAAEWILGNRATMG